MPAKVSKVSTSNRIANFPMSHAFDFDVIRAK